MADDDNDCKRVYAHPALITDLWRAANMYMSLSPQGRKELTATCERALSALDDPYQTVTTVRILGSGPPTDFPVAIEAAIYAALRTEHPQDDAFMSFGYSSEESGS